MNPPPAAPTDEGPRTEPDSAAGPRVTRDEVRDLGRLRRSTADRKIAGVAGGLARHFDVDPIIVRVSLVVLAFFGGAGLIIYLVCYLIVPTDDRLEARVRLDARSRSVALVITAAIATLALVGDSVGGWDFPWPLAVVGSIVVAVMFFRSRDDGEILPPPPSGPDAPVWSTSGPATFPPATFPPAERHNRRRGRGPALFWYAVSIIAIGIGVMCMVELAGVPIADSAYPAFALGTCGLMLVVGAFWGRAGGIILLGLIAALATVGATVANEIEAGHIDERPLAAADVLNDYHLDAGEIELDLTDVADLDNLDGRTISLSVDFGRIAVVLPRAVDVTITSNVDVGRRAVLGRETSSDSGTIELDGAVGGDGRDGAAAAASHLTLDVDVTFGDIEITQEGPR